MSLVCQVKLSVHAECEKKGRAQALIIVQCAVATRARLLDRDVVCCRLLDAQLLFVGVKRVGRARADRQPRPSIPFKGKQVFALARRALASVDTGSPPLMDVAAAGPRRPV